jgi:ATP-dependent Clp protease ATP-binding subunit ClpA
MMAFGKYVRAIIEQAAQEAQADRSATIEAQHVLLAIAARRETAEAELLSSVGLDPRGLREALDRELAQSLSAAGVAIAEFALPLASSASAREPRLGASVRHALERGVEGVRRQPRPAHLLLGVLQAQVGTVPRALTLAGIDRADLLARVQQTLVNTPP